MVSVSVNGRPRSTWTLEMQKLAYRVAERVLEGCGIPSTDRHSEGMLTIIVRRQCTDEERRKVREPYLQV